MRGMERDYGEHLIHALELVQRDIDATAEEPHRLRFVSVPSGGDASDDPIFLAIEDGSYWSGGSSCFGEDEPTARASVADTAQACLMEVTHQVWPLCPDHERGGSAILTVLRTRIATGALHVPRRGGATPVAVIP
jgi:hypothetical protein